MTYLIVKTLFQRILIGAFIISIPTLLAYYISNQSVAPILPYDRIVHLSADTAPIRPASAIKNHLEKTTFKPQNKSKISKMKKIITLLFFLKVNNRFIEM